MLVCWLSVVGREENVVCRGSLVGSQSNPQPTTHDLQSTTLPSYKRLNPVHNISHAARSTPTVIPPGAVEARAAEQGVDEAVAGEQQIVAGLAVEEVASAAAVDGVVAAAAEEPVGAAAAVEVVGAGSSTRKLKTRKDVAETSS